MSDGCCVCIGRIVVALFITSIVIIILIFIFDAASNSDEDDYDYYYDDGNSTGPYSSKYSNNFIFGGGKHGSGGGSRFGGSRGGGYCFSHSTAVWTKNETSPDATANQIMVANLREGDLVGTLAAPSALNQSYEFMWTRATDVSTYQGNWTAHTFVFTNHLQLTVTSPHLMIIAKNDKFYFIRADYVEIGDKMFVNKKLRQVTGIENHTIKSKVAIETEDGTLQANGVWTSGLCDDNFEVEKRIVEFQAIVKDYRFSHFGKEYNHMCMDAVTWKISYQRNNELLK